MIYPSKPLRAMVLYVIIYSKTHWVYFNIHYARFTLRHSILLLYLKYIPIFPMTVMIIIIIIVILQQIKTYYNL